MKKVILLILSIVSLATVANAQIGFEMGLNMANLNIKSGGTTVHTSFKPGFAIGAIGAIAVSEHVYFEPGLFYEMNGCKLKDAPTGKYSINTVQIPLNFEYKSGEKCGNRFFVGIGPFIGYNVGGSYSVDAYGAISATSATLEIGTDKTDNLKALDFGVGVNFGYQLKKRLYARAHYQMGLAELSPAADGENTLKSSAFGVTVGYLFGRCDRSNRIPGFKTAKSNHWRGMSKSKYSRKVKYPRRRY